ncbi:MAG: MarR family transcriptional regulator [Candidatus Berkelbacteria bacterium]|nr:MarR family transcriptional regulator [Candidatus Berkelbacteria bacterium]
MTQNNKLSFELQSVFTQLRKSALLKHNHSKLKGAEKHMLLLISDLKSGKPVTTSEIANKINVTLAAVTHQINALEKEGLIKRLTDKQDRRIIFIELSKKGITHVAQLKKDFAKKIRVLGEFLGEKDTRSLIRIIKKIADFPGFTE